MEDMTLLNKEIIKLNHDLWQTIMKLDPSETMEGYHDTITQMRNLSSKILVRLEEIEQLKIQENNGK